ncbi:MAG: IPT/TIG domain-containing protein [Dehalococcoidia bacterium]|nr:IPT/TIG domain-containing protein [Dehalococcoidia bacterium]
MKFKRLLRVFLATMTLGLTAAAVLPAAPVAAAAIELNTSSGSVGDRILVSGSGFSFTQNQLITLEMRPQTGGNTVTLQTLYATSISIFNAEVIIPDVPRGVWLIGVQGNSAGAAITINPKITLSASSGGGGDVITVTGTGFSSAASNPVIVQVDGVSVTTVPATVQPSGNGRFTASFTMPDLALGNHTITATQSGGTASTSFVIEPKITVTPISGSPGATVTINGSGFAPGKTVSFTIGNSIPLSTTPATVTTGLDGKFSNVTFTIPSLGGGTHTVKATDANGNDATAVLTVPSSISLSSTNGRVGSLVTVTGTGFVPGQTVSIYWDAGINALTTTTASASGAILAEITIPAGVRGTHTVKAADATGNTATTSYMVDPGLNIYIVEGTTPVTGGFGDTVTVKGSGYTAGSTISFSLSLPPDTSVPLTTNPAAVTAASDGSFEATFNIPRAAAGAWTVTANGGATNNIATATLIIIPKITINPTDGVVGDSVTITGTGFRPNQTISVTWGGTQLPTATSTDTSGSFSIDFNVPASKAGNTQVSVSDGSNSATAVFTVTANAALTTGSAGTSTSPAHVGQEITVTGTGFTPGASITGTTLSATGAMSFFNVVANSAGSFTAVFNAPAISAGKHTITIAADGVPTTITIDFYIESTAPNQVQLLSPANGSKPRQPATFTWGEVTDDSGVTYTLQISQEASFGTLLMEKELNGTGYTLDDTVKFRSGVTYYWRVQAVDGAGNEGSWSVANTLSVGSTFPGWLVHVLYILGIIIAAAAGVWFGRRWAYRSY